MTMGAAMLAGQVALVTGATSGIGRAIALALAGLGARVIASGRREDALAEVVAAIVAAGGNAHPLKLDLTDAAAIAALPGTLPPDFRDVSILVNNAGEDIGGRTRFDLSTADELARVIDTNLAGTIRLTRAIVPGMLALDRGDIVNITSTNALRPLPGVASYSASKAGLKGLSEVLRADYAKTGLRVIDVAPGLVKTGFAQTRMRGDAAKAEAFFGQFPYTLVPGDVAQAVAFALTRPRHVLIHQLVITPAFQW